MQPFHAQQKHGWHPGAASPSPREDETRADNLWTEHCQALGMVLSTLEALPHLILTQCQRVGAFRMATLQRRMQRRVHHRPKVTQVAPEEAQLWP